MLETALAKSSLSVKATRKSGFDSTAAPISSSVVMRVKTSGVARRESAISGLASTAAESCGFASIKSETWSSKISSAADGFSAMMSPTSGSLMMAAAATGSESIA